MGTTGYRYRNQTIMRKDVFTGVDIGGTNTDIAVIGDEIIAKKVANTTSLVTIFSDISSAYRLSVSTSELLNRFLTGTKPDICTITIPGPGLARTGAVSGAIGHRGEVLDPINPDEVDTYIRQHMADAIAIIGKFSVRNPCLEEDVRKIAQRYYPDTGITVSHTLGYLNMPARMEVTTINAGLKKKISRLISRIRTFHDSFYFVSGDGGLVSKTRAYKNPMALYHSSPATAALGSYYLSRQKNCLVVDIGGTTTDIIPLVDGKPAIRQLIMNDQKTGIDAVWCETVPYGGDSRVMSDLMPWREGNARAFDGKKPTLTDAVNRAGIAEIGVFTSTGLSLAQARRALETYTKSIVSVINATQPGPLVGAGYLAPFLLPVIAHYSHRRYTIPEHASCANAVGAAVSRISISLHVHADTGRGIVLYNGVSHSIPKNTDDETLIHMATEELRHRAEKEGAPPSDIKDVIIDRFNAFDVVRGWQIDARIIDFIIRVAPGITSEAP